jgi:hypothetical protein
MKRQDIRWNDPHFLRLWFEFSGGYLLCLVNSWFSNKNSEYVEDEEDNESEEELDEPNKKWINKCLCDQFIWSSQAM